MRTIAIINQKGGCGKTTVSINLAATLAAKGYRTLLVDMDPQAHCALGLAVPDAQVHQSTADLLRAGLDGTIGLDEITWQISRCLDLAPSSMALAGVEPQLAAAPDKDRRLAQVLAPVQDRYDFAIIDCPPSIGLLTFNALRAADEVLVPVETGYFAMQGATRQEKTIEMLVRRVGHHVRFRVLPTMYDIRTKLAREILSELKKHFGDRVLPAVINFNSKLKEASSFGQPITEYDAGSRGMKDFQALAQWLLDNPPSPAPAPASDAPGNDAPAPFAAAPPGSTTLGSATPGSNTPGVSHPADLPAPRNPAMSRAAELVERARALSARTAQLSAQLRHDPDHRHELPATPAPGSDPAPGSNPANTLTTEPVPAPPETRPAEVDPRLTRLYGIRHTARGVLFVQPADQTGRLAIAGDFNQWDPAANPMTRDEDLGVFQAIVQAPPGRYRYRLVRDGQWIRDPYNDFVESNPFGELNNILEIK